jgi:hypothetical protein
MSFSQTPENDKTGQVQLREVRPRRLLLCRVQEGGLPRAQVRVRHHGQAGLPHSWRLHLDGFLTKQLLYTPSPAIQGLRNGNVLAKIRFANWQSVYNTEWVRLNSFLTTKSDSC